MKQVIRRVARLCGLEVHRIRSTVAWKYSLVGRLRERGIDSVLDVGANTGQFAQQLRKAGFDGQIFSFEPMSSAFAKLRAAAALDTKWSVFNFALGDRQEARRLHVAGNSVSSSLLEISSFALKIEPTAAAIGDETVQVDTLDAVLSVLGLDPARALLKMDVQGFEQQVIAGAGSAMAHLPGVVTECSLTTVYDGEWLFSDVVRFFLSNGFRLVHADPVFTDTNTGDVLQVDAHFWRL